MKIGTNFKYILILFILLFNINNVFGIEVNITEIAYTYNLNPDTNYGEPYGYYTICYYPIDEIEEEPETICNIYIKIPIDIYLNRNITLHAFEVYIDNRPNIDVSIYNVNPFTYSTITWNNQPSIISLINNYSLYSEVDNEYVTINLSNGNLISQYIMISIPQSQINAMDIVTYSITYPYKLYITYDVIPLTGCGYDYSCVLNIGIEDLSNNNLVGALAYIDEDLFCYMDESTECNINVPTLDDYNVTASFEGYISETQIMNAGIADYFFTLEPISPTPTPTPYDSSLQSSDIFNAILLIIALCIVAYLSKVFGG
jgi:hypothetical protein